ncbi:octaprenyl-diphosphate synthase [Helicobacter didelphidarum]|uniref:Octaprenyl-diphosphate synthase n=1 Tax=Helicobacter didelphidarum TaxID=2040648 RepID=A0A3D8IRX8_9HELI|nr:polyprenyl synthetase family protein [Helicobacter didelphidarum]RDU67665.1 octaprenyl-diphosphate synthase [Helicobacter didelphidarum]
MGLERVANIALEILQNTQSKEAISLYKELECGKMLRSKLVLSIVENESAYRLCAIIELIQSASLLHDDVIDESLLRRGKTSINAKFGNKTAIMLGDILYSNAFFELSKFDSQIAQSLSQSVSLLSIGELEDVSLEQSFNNNEQKYLDMITHKSASLIAASAECAAILATHENHRDYYKYGLYLGMAFQIIDDILDITQKSENLGKPALSDFCSGKTTLPYIYLYHELDNDKKAWLKSLFKKNLNTDDFEHLHSLLLENPIKKAKQKALFYGNFALQIAQKVKNKKLESIINTMIERDF